MFFCLTFDFDPKTGKSREIPKYLEAAIFPLLQPGEFSWPFYGLFLEMSACQDSRGGGSFVSMTLHYVDIIPGIYFGYLYLYQDTTGFAGAVPLLFYSPLQFFTCTVYTISVKKEGNITFSLFLYSSPPLTTH